MELTFRGRKILPAELLLKATEHSRAFAYSLMTIFLMLVIWFIYSNVYLPLTRAVELAELKETTAVVRVDAKVMEQTISLINTRIASNTTDWSSLINPFKGVE